MKYFSFSLFLFLMLIGVNTSCADTIKEASPGGLSFGMSVQDLQRKGVVIDERTVDGGMVLLSTNDLPKTLTDFNFAILEMGNNDQLARVSLFSKPNPGDKFGHIIASRFDQLKAGLDNLYGAGELMVRRPEGALSAPENFAKAIEAGAGTMMAKWVLPGVDIYLRVGALDGATYYEIRYIDVKRMEIVDKQIKNKDLGAL